MVMRIMAKPVRARRSGSDGLNEEIGRLERNYIAMINMDGTVVLEQDVRDFLATERKACADDERYIQRLLALNARETEIKLTPTAGFEDGRWLEQARTELQQEFGVQIPKHGRDLDNVREDR